MMYFKVAKEAVVKYYYLYWFNNKDDAYSNDDVELPKLTRQDATVDLCLIV